VLEGEADRAVYLMGDSGSDVVHGAQRDGGVSEGDDGRRVGVDDGNDVGPCFVEFAVNEPLQVGGSAVRVRWGAVQVVFQMSSWVTRAGAMLRDSR
jgi:hypothetical protein